MCCYYKQQLEVMGNTWALDQACLGTDLSSAWPWAITILSCFLVSKMGVKVGLGGLVRARCLQDYLVLIKY